MDSQICALDERVARLEKANRAMKVIVAVTVLAMAAMTSTPQLLANTVKKMAALDAETIITQRIDLVNAKPARLSLCSAPAATAPGLVFIDRLASGCSRWVPIRMETPRAPDWQCTTAIPSSLETV